MNMISLYMNYCKLHFLFIFVHVDLEKNKLDWLIDHIHAKLAPAHASCLLPYHTIPHHASYHTIPYHIMPLTIPYHTTSCLFSLDLLTVKRHLVIAHFLLLLLLSGTLFQMMSGVPHHCHYLSLFWRHTCFVLFTETEHSLWSLYMCAWFGHVIDMLMAFLRDALLCIKRSKIN